MRIVLVLGSSTGGIGAHVRDLARYLVRQGHQVVVAGPAETGERFDFTGAGDAGAGAGSGKAIKFVPVAISAAPHPARDLAAVRTLRKLARHADVVHAHGVRAG